MSFFSSDRGVLEEWNACGYCRIISDWEKVSDSNAKAPIYEVKAETRDSPDVLQGYIRVAISGDRSIGAGIFVPEGCPKEDLGTLESAIETFEVLTPNAPNYEIDGKHIDIIVEGTKLAEATIPNGWSLVQPFSQDNAAKVLSDEGAGGIWVGRIDPLADFSDEMEVFSKWEDSYGIDRSDWKLVPSTDASSLLYEAYSDSDVSDSYHQLAFSGDYAIGISAWDPEIGWSKTEESIRPLFESFMLENPEPPRFGKSNEKRSA